MYFAATATRIAARMTPTWAASSGE